MDPTRFRQARWPEPTLFDLDAKHRTGTAPAPPGKRRFPGTDAHGLPDELVREDNGVPSVPRSRVMRHLSRLAQMTFGVDQGSYPLGSCTMKYNSKTPELLAHDPGLVWSHPLAPEEDVQGILALLWQTGEALRTISGLDAVSLQPAAGAQGEFVAMRMVHAFYEDAGELDRETGARCEVIVPDSAHGTNPASAAMAGFKVLEVPSADDGCVDLVALEEALSERTAAFMLTNPNTLGIFEQNVEKIAEAVHDQGAKLYYDGANLNAILGVTDPGAMGFDLMHFNVHKTFATPHGGGGPGAGPVACTHELEPFLPVPRVVRRGGGDAYGLDWDAPKSIGSVKAFHGNVGVLVRALAYIQLNGGDGLTRATRTAVANANYVYRKVRDLYPAPGSEIKKHEFVASAERLKRTKGITAMDVAKRLLDYGIHAPTVYFPLNVPEALMIEPTETESPEELDELVTALRAIANEDADVVKGAPYNTAVARVDEVGAAREPVLTWDQAPGGG